MGKTLLTKVWDRHKVATLPTGEDQLFIGAHLVHEVTSPQAFQMGAQGGLPVLDPERTFATVDHIVPTASQERPFADPLAETMIVELEKNVRAHGIRCFGLASGSQGIARRRAGWKPGEIAYTHGALYKYARLVSSASQGAVTS